MPRVLRHMNGNLGWLRASIEEQEARDRHAHHSHECGRCGARRAIEMVEQSDARVSVVEFDISHPVSKAEFNRAMADVRQERERRDRQAACILAVARLSGRFPT